MKLVVEWHGIPKGPHCEEYQMRGPDPGMFKKFECPHLGDHGCKATGRKLKYDFESKGGGCIKDPACVKGKFVRRPTRC